MSVDRQNSKTNSLNGAVPFKLHWVFGHDTKVPPINLSSPTIKGIFFCSGSVGICYDWTKRKQTMLYGHVHPILSIAVTSDKTYLASADSGPENSLIIWQRKSGSMVFILSNHFPEDGVIWMCFSQDGNLLLTLTGGMTQVLSLWEWKLKKASPYCTYHFSENHKFQHFAAFHHKDPHNFASCGKENVYFFSVYEGKVHSSILDLSSLYDEKASRRIGCFTQTVFSTNSSMVYTGTNKGMIILWGKSMSNQKKTEHSSKSSLLIEPKERICLRAIQILDSRCSISYLNMLGSFLVVGTEEGQVCYFDEDFELQWSMDITEDEICSVSFNFKPRLSFKQAVFRAMGKDLKRDDSLEKNDFIACTKNGFAGYVSVASSRTKDILFGTSNFVKDVAVHPIKPYLYIGDYNGGLQKWNYESKSLVSKAVFESTCTEIECLSIDSKGTYIACALSSGEVVIFDAVSFNSKPCFTSHDIRNKLNFIKFSPDPQHLIITDVISNVYRYQLHLLVPPVVYQLMNKANIPPEEPVWQYNGKTHQHQGHILDRMFNNPGKGDIVYFLTLGEDQYLVQYNITNSKNMKITVMKTIALDSYCKPICMSWYPLYNLKETISILSDDGRLRVYNIKNEEMIKTSIVPKLEESFERLIMLENTDNNQNENFHRCLLFRTTHSIGFAEFPIDGNPNSILAITSHPNGINTFVTNNENTFVFTAGKNDCWIYMYELNPEALKEMEKKGGSGIDAFKGYFPNNEDSDKMKKRLIYSVYALEMEMKMLKLGADQNAVLQGEIPVDFLQYVMAALGCFLLPDELQTMLNDVDFENKYMHAGKKTTLNCLDIIKLYVNHRPQVPLTKEKISESFKDILLANGDPDKISRAQFLNILESRGNPLPSSELLDIVKCLRDDKMKTSSLEEHANSLSSESHETPNSDGSEKDQDNLIKEWIPEVITKDIFFQDILCIEDAKEDLSAYVLEKEDLKLKPKPLTVDEFVFAIEESNLTGELQKVENS